MTTDVAIAGTPANIHVIAGTPAEMERAHNSLVTWSEAKVAHALSEVGDAQRCLHAAQEAGMSVRRFQSSLRSARRRLTFYQKINAALKAGYYIVPPFPVDVFAIRTNRAEPKSETSTYSWDTFDQAHKSHPRLPVGEGRYVSNRPEIGERKDDEKTTVYPKKFKDVEYPFSLVKPEIIEATAKALKAKIFDRLGVLPARRSADPIVVGQVLPPDPYGTPVTFFVAWWLDTSTL